MLYVVVTGGLCLGEEEKLKVIGRRGPYHAMPGALQGLS